MHDASKVLLGQVPSSAKTIDSKAGDPATFLAGLVVRQKSDGTISLAKSDGGILGVSLGKDMSGTKQTSVVRDGLAVPVLLTAAFTPTLGAQVAISDTTGKAIAYTDGSGHSYVNAVYASGKLTGINEAGAEVDVALIDMQGGL